MVSGWTAAPAGLAPVPSSRCRWPARTGQARWRARRPVPWVRSPAAR